MSRKLLPEDKRKIFLNVFLFPEVFLKVYKYLGRFKQDQDFFAWVYRITVNVCRDIAKQRQHHTDRFASLETTATSGLAGEQEGADEALIAAQQRELIAGAMA